MTAYLLQPGLWALLIGTAALIILFAAVARRLGWTRPTLISIALTVAIFLVGMLINGLASSRDGVASDHPGRALEIIGMTVGLLIYVGPMAGTWKVLEHRKAALGALVMVAVGSVSLPFGLFASFGAVGLFSLFGVAL